MNNLQLLISSTFNFLAISSCLIGNYFNSNWLAYHAGIIYMTFQFGFQVVSLLDMFPGADLDTEHLQKFDFM